MSKLLLTVYKTTRPAFIVLTLVCIFLAYSLALLNQVDVNITKLLVVLITAVAAHVAVNTLNEYMDFKSGLDLETQKTGFSGGSGALPANPAAHNLVLVLSLVALLLTMAGGIWLVMQSGIELLLAGLVGIILVIAYTPWINRHPLICLIAPGLGFGPVMLGGSYYVLSDQLTASVIIASTVVFFLVNNLLLLNQIPDVDADRHSGRNNLVISYGLKAAIVVYILFSLVVGFVIVLAVKKQMFPLESSLSLLPWLLSIVPVLGMMRYGKLIGEQNKVLAINVLVTLTVPLVLALSFIFSQNSV